jgi:hypothetical protein
MRKYVLLDFWSVIAVDISVIFFAIWTVCCHLLLFVHGNTFHLLLLSGSVLFLIAVSIFFLVRRGHWRKIFDAFYLDDTPVVSPPNTLSDRIAGFVGLVVAITILLAWKTYRDKWLFWGSALGFALVSYAWLLSRCPVGVASPSSEKDSRNWQEVALWVLAFLGAYITLIMHRANSDDSLYIHIAVAAADRPSLELIANDTIHNAGIVPFAVYRVHSFELLGGVISYVTGIPAIKVIHLGLATIAGLLTPLAWARLFRLLDPQRWFWMVLVVFVWYLADGTTPFSGPMHAFVRLFQGKAILLSVGIPIIATYGIRFGLKPCKQRFVMLVAAQIGAIGLSSTGLWIAPIVAMVSVCVPLQLRRRDLKVIGFGLLSCLYVIGMGLWVRSQITDMGTETSPAEIVSSLSRSLRPSFRLIENALGIIYGLRFSSSRPPLYQAYLSVILISWPLAHTQLARRYLVAFSLVFVLILANPYLYRLVIRNLTGNATYNRIVFLLPTAAALAVCFTTLVHLSHSKRLQYLLLAVSAVCLFLFFDRIPRYSVTDVTRMGFRPRLKVANNDYKAALEVARLLPADSYALTTKGISSVLPMVHHHPYLIMVKTNWFGKGNPELNVRFRLRRVVDGYKRPLQGKHQQWFLNTLNHYKIEGVVSSVKCQKVPGFIETMKIGGFHLLMRIHRYDIWRRSYRW